MKYTPSTESIPQSSRRAVNEKLLYLIDNNCCEAYGTGSWAEEIVAIGVRHTVVLDAYAAALREAFPNRPLFIVTGATTTFAKRRALRQTLRESGNGILLCTQQSLPSSVNFEFVNKVIIPELHYNNSRMSQFYMRFIRFNSVDWKDIYFLTYAQSIESNLMQMILAKEKLNLFMKGDEADMDDIYERFGVDYDLTSLLLYHAIPAPQKSKGLMMHFGESYCTLPKRARHLKSRDLNRRAPFRCPKRKAPNTLRIYYYRSPETYMLDNVLHQGFAFTPQPTASRYAMAYEGTSTLSPREFWLKLLTQKDTELLGIEVKAKSVVEIDDGLAPCFFFKTEEGYTRCQCFDADRARTNCMEGWEGYNQEDIK